MTNAAIYCRVSDPGAAEKFGMDSQERECRDYAERQGWIVTHVYREFHTGADLFERPQMTAVREAINQRAFDVLLVHRIDRLSRDQNHVAYVYVEADRHGIKIDSATEDLDESAEGQLLRGIAGYIAEKDRLKIAANTNRGRQEKARKGRPLGVGFSRYGLMWADAAKTACIENPETIGTVRRIFADYDKGQSLRAIGMALEADGILPPYHHRTGSTSWSAPTLRSILTDPVYTGHGEAFRTITVKERDNDGNKIKRRYARPADERIALPEGTFPAVIAADQFARVQARLQSNKLESQRRDRDPQDAILRRGYAVCAGCGRPLVVLERNGMKTYRCNTDSKRRWGCPYGSIGIPVDMLDAAIWDWLTAELSDEDRVSWHLEQLRSGTARTDDTATIEQTITKIRKQQANLTSAIAMLDDNPDAMASLVARLDALGKQLHAAERDLADATARRQKQAMQESALVDIQSRCAEIAATMADCHDYADRREMIGILQVKVSLYPHDAKPRWTAASVITPQGITSENVYSPSSDTSHLDAVLVLRTDAMEHVAAA